MDSIAVTKPDMGVLSQKRLLLSPFGALAQAFSAEILARARKEEGLWSYVPLDLLEEGEEPARAVSPPRPVIQVDLHLVLEALRREKGESEQRRVTERIVERILRIREIQNRPSAHVPSHGEESPSPQGMGLLRQTITQTLVQENRFGPFLLAAGKTEGQRGTASSAPGVLSRQAEEFAQMLQDLREGVSRLPLGGSGTGNTEGVFLPPLPKAALVSRTVPFEELIQMEADRDASDRTPEPAAKVLEQSARQAAERIQDRIRQHIERGPAYRAEYAGSDQTTDSEQQAAFLRQKGPRSAAADRLPLSLRKEPDPSREQRSRTEYGSEFPGPDRLHRRAAPTGLSGREQDGAVSKRRRQKLQGPSERDTEEMLASALDMTQKPARSQTAQGGFHTVSAGEDAPAAVPGQRNGADEMVRFPKLAHGAMGLIAAAVWDLRMGKSRQGRVLDVRTASWQDHTETEIYLPTAGPDLTHWKQADGEVDDLAQKHPQRTGRLDLLPGKANRETAVDRALEQSSPLSYRSYRDIPARDTYPPMVGPDLTHWKQPDGETDGLTQMDPQRARTDLLPGKAIRETAVDRMLERTRFLASKDLPVRGTLFPMRRAGTESGAQQKTERGKPAGLMETADFKEREALPFSWRMPSEAELAHRSKETGVEPSRKPTVMKPVTNHDLGGEPFARQKPWRGTWMQDRSQAPYGLATGGHGLLGRRLTEDIRLGKPAQGENGGAFFENRELPSGGQSQTTAAEPPRRTAFPGTQGEQAYLALRMAHEIHGVEPAKSRPEAPRHRGMPVAAIASGVAAVLEPEGLRVDEPGTESIVSHPQKEIPYPQRPNRERYGFPTQRDAAASVFYSPLALRRSAVEAAGGETMGGLSTDHNLPERQTVLTVPDRRLLRSPSAFPGGTVLPANIKGPADRRGPVSPARRVFQRVAGGDGDPQAAVPTPLDLAYGPVLAEGRSPVPGQTAQGCVPPTESSYVKSLPDWAQRFLRDGEAQTAQSMGRARNVAPLLPPPGEGDTVQWTAPNYQPPAALMTYREKPKQEQPSGQRPPRISQAELQHTADQVYRMIEDRIRRERRRLGL